MTPNSSDACAAAQCAECSKSYSTKNTLARHKRNHRVSKQRRCHVCGVTFQRQDLLSRHLKIHAAPQDNTSTGSNSAPLQRRRCNTACVNCRQARAKCDGMLPCAPCVKQGKTCRFEQARHRQSKSMIVSSDPEPTSPPGPTELVASWVNNGQTLPLTGPNAFAYQPTAASPDRSSQPDYAPAPAAFVVEPAVAAAFDESQPQGMDSFLDFLPEGNDMMGSMDVSVDSEPDTFMPFPGFSPAPSGTTYSSEMNWQWPYQEPLMSRAWSPAFSIGEGLYPTTAAQNSGWPSFPSSALPNFWPVIWNGKVYNCGIPLMVG